MLKSTFFSRLLQKKNRGLSQFSLLRNSAKDFFLLCFHFSPLFATLVRSYSIENAISSLNNFYFVVLIGSTRHKHQNIHKYNQREWERKRDKDFFLRVYCLYKSAFCHLNDCSRMSGDARFTTIYITLINVFLFIPRGAFAIYFALNNDFYYSLQTKKTLCFY